MLRPKLFGILELCAAIPLLLLAASHDYLWAQDMGEVSQQNEKASIKEPEAIAHDDHYSLEGERLEAIESIFAARCSFCHGKEGEGTGDDDSSNLVDSVWKHGGTLEAIKATISNGITNTLMKPQRENFNAREIEDLARFVLLLTERPSSASTELDEEKQPVLRSSAAPESKSSPNQGANFIDEYIFKQMEANNIPHAELVSDVEFMRRVYLDLWGRIPTVNAIRNFVADPNPKKRERLIDQLLGLDYARIRQIIMELRRSNPDWTAQQIAQQLVELGLREHYYPDDSKPLEAAINDIIQNSKSEDDVVKDQPRYWLVEQPFVTKWVFLFEDLFRNALDQKGNNRAQFRAYLESNLRLNVGYDYMVRDMLTATTVSGSSNGAAGFLIRNGSGIHEDACDEIAVHATRNFLGIDLRCISCHDGQQHLEKINLWMSKKTREQFWRQAAFFGHTHIFNPSAGSDRTHEFAVIDSTGMSNTIGEGIATFSLASANGSSSSSGYRADANSNLRTPRNKESEVPAEFILDGKRPAKGTNPRAEFARFITSDMQFARTVVNLIWSKFMTVGIVDPPFAFDPDRQDPQNPPPAPWTVQPSHPELLDALAKDFVDKGYDLRHLMRTICRSRAYQLSSSFNGEYKPEFDRYYARKLVRRLTAEEVHDLIVTATNVKGKGVHSSYEGWSGYATDLPCPVQEACGQELQDFLFNFGRGDRLTNEPNTDLSVLQFCTLMYEEMVTRKALASTEGSRVRTLLEQYPPWTWQESGSQSAKTIIEELYLATLSRFPTEGEMDEALSHLQQHRDIGVEDLQWALLNKAEVIVNY